MTARATERQPIRLPGANRRGAHNLGHNAAMFAAEWKVRTNTGAAFDEQADGLVAPQLIRRRRVARIGQRK